MSDLDDIFGNMEKASMSDKGTFFGAGKFKCTLKSMIYNEGFRGRSLFTNFEVVTTSNEQDPEGATRKWIAKLDNPKSKELVMGEIKSLIFCLLGQDPRTIGTAAKNPDAHAKAYALFKAQLKDEEKKKFKEKYGFDAPDLKGREVIIEGSRTEGSDFTRLSFSPVQKPA